MVIDRYQDQINKLTAEKNDEIRLLTKANELFRNKVVGRASQRKGHEVSMPRQLLFSDKNSWKNFEKPFKALQKSCN